jgi:hypothetical protein
MGRAMLIINTDDDRRKAAHWVGKAPWGTRIEFKASKRSLPQNDRLWAMLTDVADYMRQKGKEFTTEEWKLLFMHAWGREIRFLPGLDHKTVVPVGQSSSDLSKQEMTDLIEFIYAWGAENGVTFHEPPGDSSAGGDGSGEANPPPATADQSSSQESGAEAGEPEAEHVAAAAPVSDLVTRNKKIECIDKFLRAATDPTAASAKDRQETVVFAKDVWKAELAEDPAFVKACTDTANKVVKGELPADAARRYLEGLL